MELLRGVSELRAAFEDVLHNAGEDEAIEPFTVCGVGVTIDHGDDAADISASFDVGFS